MTNGQLIIEESVNQVIIEEKPVVLELSMTAVGPPGPAGPLDILTDVDVAAAAEADVLGKIAGVWQGVQRLSQSQGDVRYSALGHLHDDRYVQSSAHTLALHTGLGLTTQALLDTETSARQAADALLIPLSQRGAANGVATLDASSLIPNAQLPALAISDTYPVASQAAMLALSAQRGDVAVRTDESKSYILRLDDPSVLANWQELLTPTDAVTSIDGRVGVVDLSDRYSAVGHLHDDRYYTEAEADARFAQLAGANIFTGGPNFFASASVGVNAAIFQGLPGQTSPVIVVRNTAAAEQIALYDTGVIDTRLQSSANRVRIGSVGIEFGNPIDTNLYRSAADILKTDDSLIVGSVFSAGPASPGLTRTYIEPRSATDKGLIIRGFVSQTAALQEWQNPAATVLVSITAPGHLIIGAGSASSNGLIVDAGSGGASLARFVRGGVGEIKFSATNSAPYLEFGPGDNVTYDTNLYRSAANTLKTDDGLEVNGIGSGLLGFKSPNNRINSFGRQPITNVMLAIQSGGASNKALVVQGEVSQTANLQEWQSSAAAILSRIDKNGYFMTRKTSAPADADLATSELAIWLDDTAVSSVRFKAKVSDGSVKTASVALA